MGTTERTTTTIAMAAEYALLRGGGCKHHPDRWRRTACPVREQRRERGEEMRGGVIQNGVSSHFSEKVCVVFLARMNEEIETATSARPAPPKVFTWAVIQVIQNKIAHHPPPRSRRSRSVAAAAHLFFTTTFIITMPSPTTSNPAMPRLQAAPMPATDASPSSRLGRVIERLQSLSPIPNCEDAAAEAHLATRR